MTEFIRRLRALPHRIAALEKTLADTQARCSLLEADVKRLAEREKQLRAACIHGTNEWTVGASIDRFLGIETEPWTALDAIDLLLAKAGVRMESVDAQPVHFKLSRVKQ
jgi:HAD superfamily hydrolase (TIGR01549 family)